jgi:hypothetical protein
LTSPAAFRLLFAVYLDPASSARSGVGPAARGEFARVLGERITTTWPNHRVLEGLDQIEILLGGPEREPDLIIHPRCAFLIQSLQTYRRKEQRGEILDLPEDPQYPAEEAMDSLRGAVRTVYPEGRAPRPDCARSTPGGCSDPEEPRTMQVTRRRRIAAELLVAAPSGPGVAALWTRQPECSLVLAGPRALAVCVVRPRADQFYNWMTGGWESPFSASKHLKPLQAMEGPSSLFARVKYLDLGPMLVTRQDSAALLVTVDGSGNPLAVVDCWTLPTPTPNPCTGGWQGS